MVVGGCAFCTFLDATKAFDCVDYFKLFRTLLKRDLPSMYVRLLLNLYTNNVAHVAWNGIHSRSFSVKNGVRQGGIISPVLFCIYIDGLLCMLSETGVGCYIGNVFVAALAYADDIALLAPIPSAMRRLLRICDEYCQQFSVMFNGAKSAWLLASKSKQSFNCVPQFYIGGQRIG